MGRGYILFSIYLYHSLSLHFVSLGAVRSLPFDSPSPAWLTCRTPLGNSTVSPKGISCWHDIICQTNCRKGMANFDDDVRQNSDTLSTLVGLFSWTRFLALRIVISVRESPPLTSPVGNSWEQNLMTMKSDNSVESAEVIINSRLLLCQLL